jgi:ketosteroid isomerase-like protein
MSGENAEHVRGYYEAANHRDIDAFFEELSPAFEFHTAGAFPDLDPVYTGREEFLEFLLKFQDPWEEISIEPDELIEAGPRVLALVSFHAKGRDGIEVKLALAHLWTIEDGIAVRLDGYEDQDQARKAITRREKAQPDRR